MTLLTKEIEKKLPALASQENKPADQVPIIVKFFDPCGSWTWYATEYDPATRTFFGLVRGWENELGYFSLDELEGVQNRVGLGIERDMYFGYDHTLAEAQERAI